jgi:DNA-binding NarL/FixJ family response regulator
MLIVSDEYTFLLTSYSWLRQDARVGRIEVTTSSDEALTLADSYHPDLVLFDATAGYGFGMATVRRLCDANPGINIVVTMGDRCPAEVASSAMESGAVGVLSRKSFSADACLRLVGEPEVARAHYD